MTLVIYICLIKYNIIDEDDLSFNTFFSENTASAASGIED